MVFVLGQRFVRTPKSGRYLPKNVSGDGWTPAWIAFAELRMAFVVSSVPKRSIATSSIITSAAAMPPADHALRSVRAAGRRSAMGHKERFLPPRLSAGYGLGYGTFARSSGNGRDAPITDVWAA